MAGGTGAGRPAPVDSEITGAGLPATGTWPWPCPAAAGHCRQPVLLALPVQGIHAGRFQGNGGVLEGRELVHQHGPLRPGLGHGLTLGVAGTFGVELAGLRRPRGLVGGPVGVCGGGRQRLGGDRRGLGRLEGPGAAGSHGLQGGGLLQGVAGAADKGAQRGIQPAVAVEIAGELADLLAGLLLLLAGCRGPGGGNRGGVAPELQFHERFAVGVVGLQGGREAGFLRRGGVRQEPVDRGDLRRRRAFTGLGGGNLIRRWNLRRSRNSNSRDLNRRDRMDAGGAACAGKSPAFPGARRRRTARPSFGRNRSKSWANLAAVSGWSGRAWIPARETPG